MKNSAPAILVALWLQGMCAGRIRVSVWKSASTQQIGAARVFTENGGKMAKADRLSELSSCGQSSLRHNHRNRFFKVDFAILWAELTAHERFTTLQSVRLFVLIELLQSSGADILLPARPHRPRRLQVRTTPNALHASTSWER